MSGATRDRRFGVWIVGYRDPERPTEILDGGGFVVTDEGEVHDLGSAPGAVDELMLDLGRKANPAHRVRSGRRVCPRR
jgi:hypothetical protein